jgi:glyoxylase-like metal-dependent hydrolase (beta-lactamase superfamily II)
MTETILTKISEHIYWLPPGEPDRPSLCAVVGARRTLMLDAGASAAHARLFLDGLAELDIPFPQQVVLTHWHWDHVIGADSLNVPVIAQEQTAAKLVELAQRDWSDEGLAHHVALGEQTAGGAEELKKELPSPRDVRIAQASITFSERLDVALGGVTCQIHHIGGDHAADSSVIYIEPDRVLFLGDCLYDAIYTPKRHYTIKKLFPLLDKLLEFNAEHYIEGHAEQVLNKWDFEGFVEKLRFAGVLVQQFGTDEAAIFATVEAQIGQPPDEVAQYFIRALIAGLDMA